MNEVPEDQLKVLVNIDNKNVCVLFSNITRQLFFLISVQGCTFEIMQNITL